MRISSMTGLMRLMNIEEFESDKLETINKL
jgi:hypothetical protein